MVMKRYSIKPVDVIEKPDLKIDYQELLNKAQYEAVTSINGPHLVIAGAGTGKTRTLVYRVAHMIERGIAPESILLLTFTRKAAIEMMRRASEVLDSRCTKINGGTFHSFAFKVLRKHYGASITVVDRGDAEDIINLIRSGLKDIKKSRRFPKKGTIYNIISKTANRDIDVYEATSQYYSQYLDEIDGIVKIAENYKAYKKERNILDYDDLLLVFRDMLKENVSLRQELSLYYRYIMVDEFQDTNRVQGEITSLLASEHNNIMAVGDDAQSIYSFRGAHYRNILDFPGQFDDCRIIRLEENYRSTAPVLDLANAVISSAGEKFEKNLYSDVKGLEKPVLVKTVDENEQAAFVAQRILELREEEVPLNKIAVLFRSGWHSNILEVELKKRNIPYRKTGGLKFSESSHIKDIVAWLRVINNYNDETAWLRILLMLEGVGNSTAAVIIDEILTTGGFDGLVAPVFGKKKFGADLKLLRDVMVKAAGESGKLSSCLELVIESYKPWFKLKYDDHKKREKDIESFHQMGERYEDIETFLADMAIDPPETATTEKDSKLKEDEFLNLSTIHSAKGLEWHSVFIIHMTEGFFPSAMSGDSADEFEEERRLFYVAVTRAMYNLYISIPQLMSSNSYSRKSEKIFCKPSKLLKEVKGLKDLTEMWTIENSFAPF